MQAVVRTPLIKIEGRHIPQPLIKYLRETYGHVDVISDPEEEVVEVRKSQWYKDISAKMDPGLNIKIYREMHHLTQEALGRRMGTVSRQRISNMENGRLSISKRSALKLASIFNVSVEKFI